MALGKVSDFTRVAHRYDATRDIPPEILARLYEQLIKSGILPAQGRVLDVGCGTGQISLPLAAMGFAVRGYDISAAMVALANAKCPPALEADFRVGDARELPEADDSADAVLISKLFMHIEDWRLACLDCMRVLKPGASLIHIRDRGAFSNEVRRYFTAAVDALGYKARFLGVIELEAFIAHMRSLGCTLVPVDVQGLGWQSEITYGEALRLLQERLFAEFWYLPTEDYEKALSQTRHWIESQPHGTASVQILSPHLAVEVFRKMR